MQSSKTAHSYFYVKWKIPWPQWISIRFHICINLCRAGPSDTLSTYDTQIQLTLLLEKQDYEPVFLLLRQTLNKQESFYRQDFWTNNVESLAYDRFQLCETAWLLPLPFCPLNTPLRLMTGNVYDVGSNDIQTCYNLIYNIYIIKPHMTKFPNKTPCDSTK